MPLKTGHPEQTRCASALVVVVWSFSRVRLFETPWTVARQAPLSVEFSRQEYWSGLPCPTPGDLPDPGIEMSPALAGGFFINCTTGKPSRSHGWALI